MVDAPVGTWVAHKPVAVRAGEKQINIEVYILCRTQTVVSDKERDGHGGYWTGVNPKNETGS
jgi:hypothetical protein